MLDKKLIFGGVFFMSKYTLEFKIKVVNYCLENKIGFIETAKHFGISNKSSVQKWVRKYMEHGYIGLEKNKQKYDGKFKQIVIEYMHENYLSYRETAIRFNLGGHDIVERWERIYYEKGPQGLYEERRGQRKNMNFKSKKKKISKEMEEDLIAENQRLRMENEYLKKLNALVQERIKQENKKK
jgi:transposase